MRTFDIADIRSHPELKAQAAAWFHSKWEVPEEEYLTSMDECISGGANVPQWYVALEDGGITGGVGVIENDFHVRRDLSPNVCALYVEPRRRGLGLAPENLKQIMGHTDYSTTVNNYISADVDELIAAAESASVTNTLLTNEKQSKNSTSKSS